MKNSKRNFGRVLWASLFIILLFSFLPVWGQESMRIKTNTDFAKEWLENEGEYFNIMFVTAYDEYTKECYADSTEITYWKFITKDDGAKGWVSGYDQLVTEWIHVEPTFQGFIEFLRGKGKKAE